ncbi:MAG TPA: DUF1732 domain-containing protein [Patescibacteria group bacterium]|nr:DUF1732 domain-containing protein [Patescibacteria group bacterium]
MKSMTGFAQGRFNFKDVSLFLSFKSYNNRYLETNFRGSGISAASEKIIKEIFKDKLHRGKIEVVFDLFQRDPRQWDIKLNTGLLEEIMDKIAPLQKKYGPGLNLSLDSLFKLPMVFRLDHDPELLSPKNQLNIKKAIAKVFAAFLENRRLEGQCILKDLLASISEIEKYSKSIHAREKDFEKEVFRNYRKKIEKFVKDLPLDEKRIVQEAAISADKTSIAEEINRLRTHTQRLKHLLQDKSIATQGREADFLTQEMQRETHTIAAKTSCLDIHRQILLIRREIEKIRQQVQNIE